MNRFLLALMFLLFAGSAEAATRYVDSVCPNSITIYNPTAAAGSRCGGGSSTVYTTIANGVAATSGGDTLYIRGGTYNQQLPFPAGGKAGAPTIISRYQSETVTFVPGANTITGTATAAGNSYVTFDGLIFDGTGTSGFRDGFSICCYGTGPSNIIFQNGEIKNFDGNGISLHADNIQILNSSIHNNGSNTSAGPGHGIYSSCHTGCVIAGNHFYNNDHYGIHIYDSGQSNVSNHLVYNNTVNGNGKSTVGLNSGGFGILLSSGSNNQAYNNVVYDNGAAGLTSGGIQVSGCSACLAYNNTIYGNANYGIDIYPSASGAIVKNNISFGNALGSIIDEGSSGLTADHNYCSSGCTGTGTINSATNPFVNAPTDFHLVTGSSAIDAGTSGISPGVNVPACSGGTTLYCYNGKAPDLGAFETGVPTAGGGPPTLTPNLTSVAPGATILLTVDDDDVNERIESPVDWIGLYVPGANIFDWIDWTYMNGTKVDPTTSISDAVVTFTAPLTPGPYEFRFYANGSALESDRLATAAFTVVAPGIVMKFAISTIKIGPSVTWKIGTP